MDYKPTYDTTIQVSTRTVRHDTRHLDHIDWDYPFDDPKHTSCMGADDARKREWVEQQKEYLRVCERFEGRNVWASTYGGWPRIWVRVAGVGMVSKWPYWTPRPSVLLEGTLGYAWADWASLTGAEDRTK